MAPHSKTLSVNAGAALLGHHGCRRDILAALTVCLGPLSLGSVLGYSSPAGLQIQNEGLMTQDQISWFASIITLGALVGGPLAGVMIAILGRKTCILLSTVPYVFGWFLIAASQHYLMFYGGRLLTGLAGGMTSLCVPVYIAEIADRNWRGRPGAAFQIGTTSGILFVYSVGSCVGWQWTAVVCSTLPVAMMLLVLLIPETPRWYLSKDRRDCATHALYWLRNGQSPLETEKEMQEMESNVQSHAMHASLMDFLHKSLYRPLLVSLALMVFQQLCGINVVIFYTHSIFEEAGFSGDPGVPSIIIAAVKVAATCLSTSLMDKAGRKTLFILGGVMMGISCVSFGVYFFFCDTHGVKSLSWLSLSSLILYVMAFSIGWGAIPWLIMSEIFPLRARGKATAMATCVNWLTAFIITKEFLDLEHYLTRYGTFWLFGGVCVLGTIFCVFFMPETKNKSLEEIEEYFH